MEGALLRLLQEAFPSRTYQAVAGLASISGGWESEVYSFTAEHSRTQPNTAEYEEMGEHLRQDLILRIYPGADSIRDCSLVSA